MVPDNSHGFTQVHAQCRPRAFGFPRGSADAARLVDARRSGKRVLYCMAGEDVILPLLNALGRMGTRNMAEVERVMAEYFRVLDNLEPVSRGELTARLRDGLVTVLDVRPHDEFMLGHIHGALSVPLSELERRLAGLPVVLAATAPV